MPEEFEGLCCPQCQNDADFSPLPEPDDEYIAVCGCCGWKIEREPARFCILKQRRCRYLNEIGTCSGECDE